MTAPKMDWRVSIGNIIQIVSFLVTIGVLYASGAAELKSTKDAIVETRAEQARYEVRLRTLETDSARADERLSSIYTLLSRIDSRLERIERNPQ